ncbi:hypothetical protein NDU88_010542 [Pleurodeles waltl]|uniref:Uncharacterized protein n=1 Tax=Pleurodeles waltl TaxID=8319 RepID=A0AAV7Q2I1_PLEWA|nr:hypothetical protein NDU88_010542 [Pleurodeles waltl]
MFGVPRANNAERNPEQRKTAAREPLHCECDAKEKLIGTRSERRSVQPIVAAENLKNVRNIENWNEATRDLARASLPMY